MNAHWLKPERVRDLLSLAELLPTFNGVAGTNETIEPPEGVDLVSFTGQPRAKRERKFMLCFWPRQHQFPYSFSVRGIKNILLRRLMMSRYSTSLTTHMSVII